MKTRRSNKRKIKNTIKKGGVYTTKKGKLVITKEEINKLPQHIQEMFVQRKSNPDEFKEHFEGTNNYHKKDLTQAEIEKFLTLHTLNHPGLSTSITKNVSNMYKYYTYAGIPDITKLQEILVLCNILDTYDSDHKYLSRLYDIILSHDPMLEQEIDKFKKEFKDEHKIIMMYRAINEKLKKELKKKQNDELYIKQDYNKKNPYNKNLKPITTIQFRNEVNVCTIHPNNPVCRTPYNREKKPVSSSMKRK